MEITSNGDVKFGNLKHTTHGSGLAITAGISPCVAANGGLRNAQCQQNLSFCGYDAACATPSLVIVQRRAPPCLCNASPCLRNVDPHARALPISLSWVPHIGFTPPVYYLDNGCFFFHLRRVQKDAKHGFEHL